MKHLIGTLMIMTLLLTAASAAKRVKVPLQNVPKIDVSAFDAVGIVEFEGVDERMNLNTQIAADIRKRILREEMFSQVRIIPLRVFRSALEAVQEAEADITDEDLWRSLGEELGVELLIYGSYSYDSEYRPGFVRRRTKDERTGLIYYEETYKEMVGFRLDLTLEVVDLLEGERLASRDVTSESIVEDRRNVQSSDFLKLMARLYRPIHFQMFPPKRNYEFFLLE